MLGRPVTPRPGASAARPAPGRGVGIVFGTPAEPKRSGARALMVAREEKMNESRNRSDETRHDVEWCDVAGNVID